MEKAILVYANDVRLGKYIGKNTQSRCDEAIDFIIREKFSGYIVLTAGQKGFGFPKHKKLMTSYIFGELITRGYQNDPGNRARLTKSDQSIEFLVPGENAYGTYPETQLAIQVLKGHSIEDLAAITGKNHMFRVRFFWKIYFRNQLTSVRFVSSKWEWGWRLLPEALYVILMFFGFKSKHKILQVP